MKQSNQSLKKTQERLNNLKDKVNYKVMFFDEGRFGLRSTTMRIWGEKGKVTTVKVMQGFKNFYAYSAVCPFDGENFSLLLPGVNTEYMSIYLEQLSLSFPETKILLIMDQAGWHKSRELKAFVNIEIIYLPAYSPELNPVEKLWEWIKKECSHNFIYPDLEDLGKAVCDEYQKLSDDDFKRLCNCNYLSLFI